MAEGIIPGPNFKFQVREFAPDIYTWSEWQDAHPSCLKEVDGFHVLEENGFVQVRIVFLPEES